MRKTAVVVCQKFVGETFCVRTTQRTHDLRMRLWLGIGIVVGRGGRREGGFKYS